MAKIPVNVVLVTALVLPVVLFWHLDGHTALGFLAAAGTAVAVGWLLNIVWAFVALKAATQGLPQTDNGMLKIAAAFGWFCPAILVALTWLALRLFARSMA